MADCRSLIEFCRAQNSSRMPSSSSPRKRTATRSLNPLLSHPFFCDHSPFFAAIDIVILLLSLFALGVLTLPYFKFILQQSLHLLPQALDLLGEVIYRAPVAYAAGMLLASVSAFAAWEITDHIGRKCGKPRCKGMRKGVEFDIQIESEERVRCSMGVLPPKEGFGVRPLGFGQEHKELEAELKKMAPPNGRTVLIFRAPCGCPAGDWRFGGIRKSDESRNSSVLPVIEKSMFMVYKKSYSSHVPDYEI